jgi:hypothetical protein
MVTQMDKKSIANHLGLALTGDEQQLKGKVEKLYKVLTRKPIKKPGRARRRLKFVQTDKVTWQVILEREDAKQVEEIWFDFVDRKNLDGDWRIEVENGKPKPTWRVSQTFCFTFTRVPDKKSKPRTTRKKEEKPTVATVMNKIATLSEEDKKAMLELLKQK